MKKYVWARTLLNVYRYLQRVTEDIDVMIERIAEGSFYVTSSNFFTSSTMAVSNNIIALSERKINLINLKILIENVLGDCKESALLAAKFVDGIKPKEIAKLFDINVRTYFRKLNNGLESFNLVLKRQGYTDAKLRELVKDENWILVVYEQMEEGESELDMNAKLLKKLALG